MDFRSAVHFSRIRDSGREFAISARFATFRATFPILRLDGLLVSIGGPHMYMHAHRLYRTYTGPPVCYLS